MAVHIIAAAICTAFLLEYFAISQFKKHWPQHLVKHGKYCNTGRNIVKYLQKLLVKHHIIQRGGKNIYNTYNIDLYHTKPYVK